MPFEFIPERDSVLNRLRLSHETNQTATVTGFDRTTLLVVSVVLAVSSWWGAPSVAMAQLDFELKPIDYYSAPLSNPVSQLQQRINSGEVQLQYDPQHGYLPAVLQACGISTKSQTLVFSKTSLQFRQISPRRPRAVYFNDDVYVGWVQRGDVVELSAADPRQGGVFYTLSQEQTDQPRFVRDKGQCLACHASARTSGVPGHLVRSVYTSRSGQPFFSSGTYTTDHRSPFEQRWGGWYVTGTHGQQRHMGNVIAKDRDRPRDLDVEYGANVVDLSNRINTKPYLSPHSDIVALLVLQHQTRMHNLITRANFETRSALYHDQVMSEVLDHPEGYRSESTKRRIKSAANKLVEYMLFVDEAPLSDRVTGTSGFAEEFSQQGPRDQRGRSLRDLDLQSRLMKYPCSFLVYTDSFDGLPPPVKEEVYRRLHQILTESVVEPKYERFTTEDRLAILEILRDTKSDLPDYWLN